jgi:HD-GYP domain-containing protein (c-di-GMP phosphodiesterase class II)
MGGDEFCVLARLDGEDAVSIARIGVEALSDSGDGFSIGCSYGIALAPSEAASAEEALRIADQRMYEHKAAGPRVSATRQTADVLLQVLTEQDGRLAEHGSGVARLAGTTAERLGMTEFEVRQVQLAAQLHDVGKSAIPDSILDKPGPLDDEEWQFMRRHTLIGERIVRAAPALSHAAPLIRSSHERVDGGGYPDGLERDQIPLGARVIAVCDAFDAMITERSYRAGVSVAEALAELRRCAGTQFDPDVVAEFCALAEDLAPLGGGSESASPASA